MNSRSTILVVVGGLALALLACIAGAIVLAALGDPLPDLLKEVGVGALAGLAGILARTNTEPDPNVQALAHQAAVNANPVHVADGAAQMNVDERYGPSHGADGWRTQRPAQPQKVDLARRTRIAPPVGAAPIPAV